MTHPSLLRILFLLLLPACNNHSPTPLERVKTAFGLLDKAPHYRISAYAGLNNEAPLFYTLDYLAPDRLHYRAQNAEAIAIGNTYYDRFGDGPWNVGSTDTNSLKEKLGAADLLAIKQIKLRGDILAPPHQCYQIIAETAEVDNWSLCINLNTGLLHSQYFELQGESLTLLYNFSIPISIIAPI